MNINKVNEINKETMREFFEGILSKPVFSQVQAYNMIHSAQEELKKRNEIYDKFAKHWYDVTIYEISEDDIYVLEGKPSKSSEEYWYKPFVKKNGKFHENSSCTNTLDEAIILSMIVKYNADESGLPIVLKALNMGHEYSFYFEEKATGKLMVLDSDTDDKAWIELTYKHNTKYGVELSKDEIKELYTLKDLA